MSLVDKWGLRYCKGKENIAESWPCKILEVEYEFGLWTLHLAGLFAVMSIHMPLVHWLRDKYWRSIPRCRWFLIKIGVSLNFYYFLLCFRFSSGKLTMCQGWWISGNVAVEAFPRKAYCNYMVQLHGTTTVASYLLNCCSKSPAVPRFEQLRGWVR